MAQAQLQETCSWTSVAAALPLEHGSRRQVDAGPRAGQASHGPTRRLEQEGAHAPMAQEGGLMQQWRRRGAHAPMAQEGSPCTNGTGGEPMHQWHRRGAHAPMAQGGSPCTNGAGGGPHAPMAQGGSPCTNGAGGGPRTIEAPDAEGGLSWGCVLEACSCTLACCKSATCGGQARPRAWVLVCVSLCVFTCVCMRTHLLVAYALACCRSKVYRGLPGRTCTHTAQHSQHAHPQIPAQR